MDFNQVFAEVGEFGPYQCVMCVILASSMVPAVLSNLNVVFIMGVTDYWCHVPHLQGLNSSIQEIKNVTLPLEEQTDGGSLGYSQCEMYDRNYTGWTEADVDKYLELGPYDNASSVPCLYGWEFDTELYGQTATTQWSLVCEMRWWQAAAFSFYAFGMFASLLIYGTLADLLGRRPLLCVSYVLFLASNFLTAAANSHQFLLATRFLAGFFSTPFFGGTFVLVSELIGPSWRGHVNAWYGYLWSVAGMVMAGLAYVIRDWRKLQLTLSGIMTLNMVFFLVPESPRWLYIKGRRKQADKIFHRIARSNKRQFNPEKLHSCDISELQESSGYLWDMFRTRPLVIKTCVTFCNWFAASLCYYGLTLNSTSLGANEYLSFVLSMLVEVPGIVLCHVIAVRVGRRWPLVVSMVISGVFLLLTMLCEQGSGGLIALVSLGKMSCTLAFNLLYIYMVELYPTVIRSISSSAGNFVARLGSILAPFIAQLSDLQPSLPMVIFGLCSLTAGFLAILLPETIGIYMEDSLSADTHRKDEDFDEKELELEADDKKMSPEHINVTKL